MSPAEIAEAIDSIAADPERARAMGENGRSAVVQRYNWAIEERKLLALYGEVSARPASGLSIDSRLRSDSDATRGQFRAH